MYYNPRKLLEGNFPKGSEYVYPLLPFFYLSTPLKHSSLFMVGSKMHLSCEICVPKTFIDSSYCALQMYQLKATIFSRPSCKEEKLRENVPEDRVKSQKCGTCLKN